MARKKRMCSVTLPARDFETADKLRGDISRARYVRHALMAYNRIYAAHLRLEREKVKESVPSIECPGCKRIFDGLARLEHGVCQTCYQVLHQARKEEELTVS